MSDFTLRELECFRAVAEELSFTRAAERLRLAQPPLSRHIRALEERLGAVLFERTKRRVSLTAAGRVFLAETRGILPQLERAAVSTRRTALGETERLEVAFVSALLTADLAGVFRHFRQNHPQIRLALHDCLPSAQLEAVARGRLDAGLIGVPPDPLPAGIAVTPWREEALMAFLPMDHRLAGETSICLRELAGEPFVMVSPEAAPAFAAQVREMCHLAGFRPRGIREAERAQAVAVMSLTGPGLAILPSSLNHLTGNGIPLQRSDQWRTSVQHVVAHRADPAAATRKFLDMLNRG